LKFGLVGAGCIGEIRTRALKQVEGCILSAIADPDQQRARVLAPSKETRLCKNYRELLATAEVESIIVATPPHLHEEIVISALENGKHVICEKPLANTVEACRRMVELARKTGKTLAVGFNHRYFPAIQVVKRTLDSGVIGELDHIRAFAGHQGLSQFRNPWEYDQKVVGGGALMDVGIHMIDLIRYLLGDVEEVFGVATNRVWQMDNSEDNGFALMRSPRGKHAALHATWTEWKGYRFHIQAYGDKGMALAYYAPMMNMIILLDGQHRRRSRKFHFYPMNILREKFRGWQYTAMIAFQQEFIDFLRLVEGKNGIIAEGFDGFRAVEIANAIYLSSRRKMPIRLARPF
jgi:predicted dehydrogenase